VLAFTFVKVNKVCEQPQGYYEYNHVFGIMIVGNSQIYTHSSSMIFRIGKRQVDSHGA
jgi:hypothetical protein